MKIKKVRKTRIRKVPKPPPPTPEEKVQKKIARFAKGAAVVFTDGGCYPNPGPAGAAAVIYLPDGRVIEAYQPVAEATNNIVELGAVALALDILKKQEHSPKAAVEIFSDSTYVKGCLTDEYEVKANVSLVESLKAMLEHQKHRFHWVKGHVGIEGNEWADRLATKAVEQATAGNLERYVKEHAPEALQAEE